MDKALPQESLSGEEASEDGAGKSSSTDTVTILTDYEQNELNGGLIRKD